MLVIVINLLVPEQADKIVSSMIKKGYSVNSIMSDKGILACEPNNDLIGHNMAIGLSGTSDKLDYNNIVNDLHNTFMSFKISHLGYIIIELDKPYTFIFSRDRGL